MCVCVYVFANKRKFFGTTANDFDFLSAYWIAPTQINIHVFSNADRKSVKWKKEINLVEEEKASKQWMNDVYIYKKPKQNKKKTTRTTYNRFKEFIGNLPQMRKALG